MCVYDKRIQCLCELYLNDLTVSTNFQPTIAKGKKQIVWKVKAVLLQRQQQTTHFERECDSCKSVCIFGK